METLNISCVNYSNSFPFTYGIKKFADPSRFLLSTDHPADCYQKLQNSEIDIGLVPVVALKYLPEARIVSPFCIGARGKVKSVILYSKESPGELKKVYLDYQSRTSVELVKVLYREFWKSTPEYIPANAGYESLSPAPNTGNVIIGDRALHVPVKEYIITDLAESWFHYCGYPFVFAAWISLKDIPVELLDEFNGIVRQGIENIPDVVRYYHSELSHMAIDPYSYYSQNIHYKLDTESRKGLELFLNLLPEPT